MARNTKKTTDNPTQLVAKALNTPVNLEWGEVAEKLELTIPQLQERMAAKLDDSVYSWDTIPHEHQPVIEAIARDLEAEKSVRRLEATTEPPIPTPEPPVIEDEPQPKKRGGRPKKESTALTQRKTSSLKNNDQKAQQLAASDQQVKVALHARKGQKSGAQLATIELAAEDATYRQIKGQALARKVGQLTNEIAS